MSNILISPPPTTLLTGLLQLSGGVAMSSTPVYVTDQNNTASVLALSTSNVKIGTTTASSYLLDVNGNARIRTNFEITSGTTADMYLNYQNSGNIYYQYSGVTYWQQSVDNADNFRIYSGTKGLHIQRANGYSTFNNGSTTLSSILGVKGSGSTSATTSLLVQNSSSVDAFKITDDGKSYFTASLSGTSNPVLTIENLQGYIPPYDQQLLALKSAGVNKFTVTGTGGVSASDYTATYTTDLTSVAYKGNGTGNGIYMPSANVTGIVTSSTERMRVTSAGNVGIGTTSPYKLLSVRTSTSTEALEVRATTGNTGIRFSIADTSVTTDGYSKGAIYYLNTGASSAIGTMIFALNNTFDSSNVSTSNERMRITPSGSLLIGTTTESARLQVLGSGTTSATSSLLVQNSSGTQVLKAFDDTSVEIGNQASSTAGKITVTPTDSNYYFAFGWHFFGSKNYYQMNIYGNTDSSVGVAIGKGTTSAVNSSILELSSSTKGFLPPRMTTVQKLAIATPTAGLQVYDTTLNQMSYYNGGAWVNF